MTSIKRLARQTLLMKKSKKPQYLNYLNLAQKRLEGCHRPPGTAHRGAYR